MIARGFCSLNAKGTDRGCEDEKEHSDTTNDEATPIQPMTRPAIVALRSPSRVARQERADAVVMQEELKIVEDGVPSKSSFTSVDVHEDGYLLLLQ